MFCKYKDLIARRQIENTSRVLSQRSFAHMRRYCLGVVDTAESRQGAAHSEIHVFVVRLESRIEKSDSIEQVAAKQRSGHGCKADFAPGAPGFAVRPAIAASPSVRAPGQQIPSAVYMVCLRCLQKL